MKSYQTLFFAGLVLAIVAGIILANSNGLNIEAYTGASGESTCAECHGPLNTGVGSVSIIADGDYTPGDTLDVTVAITHPGQTRWGFELTALDGSDLPAGDLISTDAARIATLTALSGREYITHTVEGTDATHGNATEWSFKWAAPVTDVGAVTFYVAGVAANAASGPNGDYAYSDTHTLLTTHVSDIAGAELPDEYHLGQNYPNPFNPSTTVDFSLPGRMHAELAVYNVVGQVVKILWRGELSAGSHEFVWDGTSQTGQPVASGTYFYRLRTERFCESKAMVLLK